MSAVFDIEARVYDQNFTETPVGILQRKNVKHWLSKMLQNNKSQTILEVNCGTGEDALYFARLGHQVYATDISQSMISVAMEKSNFIYSKDIHFEVLDIRDISERFKPGTFHLIFSNFGGLNCLSSKLISEFFENSHQLLKPKGKLVLILMAKHCLSENLYFLLKGRKNRRNTKDPVNATVSGENFSIWYYSSSELQKLGEPYFKLIKKRPIGFFVPPSYLDKNFRNKTVLLKFLGLLDKIFKNFSFLSDHADHIYLEFQKK